MNFKENLKTTRRNKGFTQEILAKKIEVSKFTIQKYEQGNREPNLEQLERIKIALGCLWEDLLG